MHLRQFNLKWHQLDLTLQDTTKINPTTKQIAQFN